MSYSLDAALKQLPPSRIIMDYDRPIERTGEQYITSCPACGAGMRVEPSGVRCANPQCCFKNGSSIDLLAQLEGGFDNLGDRLIMLYPDILPEHSAAQVAGAMVEEAKQRRSIFSFFLRQALEPRDCPASHFQIFSWLRKSNIIPIRNSFGVHVLTPAEYAWLAELLLPFTDAIPGVTKNDVLVFVGYGDYHTVASLRIIFWNGHPEPEHKVVEVVSSKYSYFGLLDIPVDAGIIATSNPAEALANNGLLGHVSRSLAYLGIVSHPTAKVSRYLPESVVSCVRLEDPSACKLPAALHRDGVSVAVSATSDMSLCVDWLAFVTASVFSLLETSRGIYDAHVRMLLDIVQLPKQELAALCAKISASKGDRVASEIMRNHSSVLVFEDETCAVYDRPEGYFLRKSKSATEHRLTNFTLQLQRLITFDGAADSYYEGLLFIQGHPARIKVSPTDLDSIGGLERAARLVGKLPEESTELPTVFDRALAKSIPQILRNQTMGVPREKGLEYLGWSPDLSCYRGPGWSVDVQGLRWTPSHLHPDRFWRRLYSQVQQTQDLVVSGYELSQASSECLALIMGFIARAFLGLRVRPVALPAASAYSISAQTIFGALGQAEMLPFSAGQRRPDLTALHSFPVLATADDMRLVKDMQQAMLVLADLPRQTSKVAEPALSGLTLPIIARAIQLFLQTPDDFVCLEKFIDPRLTVAAAGCCVLRAAFPAVPWQLPASTCPGLEALLTAYDSRTIGGIAEHDVLSQVVRIKIPEAGLATDIVLELSTTVPGLKLLPDACTLELPATVFLPMLTDYYQCIPTLPVVGVDGPLKDLT